MPRYFFNQVDKQIDPDAEGLVLKGLLEAQAEAILFAADIARKNHANNEHNDFKSVEVTDDTSKLLFTVSITFLEGDDIASSSL